MSESNLEVRLRCVGYEIIREPNELVEINARLKLMTSPRDSKSIAEALKRIELYLAEQVNLVKSELGKPRCFYCGVLNDSDANSCSQCGAPL